MGSVAILCKLRNGNAYSGMEHWGVLQHTIHSKGGSGELHKGGGKGKLPTAFDVRDCRSCPQRKGSCKGDPLAKNKQSVLVRDVGRGSCEEVQTQTSASTRVLEVSNFSVHWILLDRAPPDVSSLQGRAALFSSLLKLCHCKRGFGCRGLFAKSGGIPGRTTARIPVETCLMEQ